MLSLRNLSSVSLKTRRDFGRQEAITPTEIVTENNESVSFFRKNFGRQETVIPDPEIITEEISPVSFLRKNFGRQEPIIETITNDIISIRPNHNKTRRNFRDGGSAIATMPDPSGLIFSSTDTLTFNGTSTTYNFTPAKVIGQPTQITSWTLLLKFNAQQAGTTQDILNSADTSENPRLSFSHNGKLGFYYIGTSPYWSVESSQLISYNTDYSLMIRVTALNSGDLYLNKIAGNVGTATTNSLPNFAKDYRLGNYPFDGQWFFKGIISYLKMFNRALTDAEAATLGFS